MEHSRLSPYLPGTQWRTRKWAGTTCKTGSTTDPHLAPCTPFTGEPIRPSHRATLLYFRHLSNKWDLPISQGYRRRVELEAGACGVESFPTGGRSDRSASEDRVERAETSTADTFAHGDTFWDLIWADKHYPRSIHSPPHNREITAVQRASFESLRKGQMMLGQLSLRKEESIWVSWEKVS